MKTMQQLVGSYDTPLADRWLAASGYPGRADDYLWSTGSNPSHCVLYRLDGRGLIGKCLPGGRLIRGGVRVPITPNEIAALRHDKTALHNGWCALRRLTSDYVGTAAYAEWVFGEVVLDVAEGKTSGHYIPYDTRPESFDLRPLARILCDEGGAS